eukprot:6829864-Pyramimonas_sp.AAC.1
MVSGAVMVEADQGRIDTEERAEEEDRAVQQQTAPTGYQQPPAPAGNQDPLGDEPEDSDMAGRPDWGQAWSRQGSWTWS